MGSLCKIKRLLTKQTERHFIRGVIVKIKDPPNSKLICVFFCNRFCVDLVIFVFVPSISFPFPAVRMSRLARKLTHHEKLEFLLSQSLFA